MSGVDRIAQDVDDGVSIGPAPVPAAPDALPSRLDGGRGAPAAGSLRLGATLESFTQEQGGVVLRFADGGFRQPDAAMGVS